MTTTLLTGLSGVGKSTLIVELVRRGRRAVDLDTDEWSTWVDVADADAVRPGRDWVWREDRVAALLAGSDDLIVSGTAANMGRFLAGFDHVVLLTAPVDHIRHRLQTRTTNSYGRRPDELSRVLEQKESVETLLRAVATAEIDTSDPLDLVVGRVLALSSSTVNLRGPHER